jgi:hypothetical protein
MLINGEDGSPYKGGDLGFFKSVLSKAKTVGKVAVAPQLFLAKKSFDLVKPASKTALAMVTKPFTSAAGQPMQEVSTAPACGFFQKIARAFGGSPNCQ